MHVALPLLAAGTLVKLTGVGPVAVTQRSVSFVRPVI
jgi:hypothetical protein